MKPTTWQTLSFLLILIPPTMLHSLLIKSIIETKFFKINRLKCLIIWEIKKSFSQMLFLHRNRNRLIFKGFTIEIHRRLIPCFVIDFRETVWNNFLFLKNKVFSISWVLSITILLKTCIDIAVTDFGKTFLS